ncbi:MAG TPA: helicase HerA-like domain-containing protein, partial [Acidobacteriota bacterium]|nr:helicase HerA-like domain-containing protein [Acidobacteriota bacterium]
MNANELLIAKGEKELFILPRMVNRHGMIAGATGTGKTVSLQVLAENLSRIGVPTFMADVKGDLSGISQPGTETPRIRERIDLLKLRDFAFAGNPVTFWDVFGEQGHPVRTTISDMGPLLLSRLLNLNEIQSGVLSLVFRVADDNGLLLLDFKDLRAMVQYAGDNAGTFETEYGRVSTASVGAIQRGLLALEEQGGDKLFGEPALNLDDLMQTDGSGRGMINVLAADKLMFNPMMYATFLLWLLAELFERLPEVGDQDKPRLVFFFDEAHLLFTDAPPVLLQKIEQVVRLIRSKGVGVFFISQNPLDIPDVTLGQLGNRIQHGLRAFTPREQRAVRAAAETFRQNPKVDVEKVIMELGVGEALVSFLDEKGQPSVVERAFVLPPGSRIGPITPEARQEIIRKSLVFGHYERTVDRDSAYEMLKNRTENAVRRRTPEVPQQPYPSYPAPDPYRQAPAPRRPAGRRDTLIEAMAK